MPTHNPLRDLAISSSGFVFDPHSGATFTLNASGLAILLALRDGDGPGEIAADLRAGFDAVSPHVEQEIAEFLTTLRLQGLAPADTSQPTSNQPERKADR